MIKYNKTNLLKTAQEVKTALQAMNDFINPEKDSAGVRQPDLDQKLNEIWNNGDNLPYEFIDKTEAEEKQELAEAEAVELAATPEAIAKKRKNEILAELLSIDQKSIRALRGGSTEDQAELVKHEESAGLLREELKVLV